MQRLLNVFLSMESTGGTSLLSTYSTSGLLNESQVDIVSSNEAETPSDLVGDMSILEGAGTAVKLGTVSLLLKREVILLGTATSLDWMFKEAGKLSVESLALLVQSFFTLAILVTHGTFISETTINKLQKSRHTACGAMRKTIDFLWF